MNQFNLTERELEVLQARAWWGGADVIAKALGISPGTVGNHTRNIIVKMKAKNITHAVAMAWYYGLII